MRKIAGPTVQFRSWLQPEKLPELYRNAKALLFPGEEDFGITPLESMACGRPVIAYGKGGVRETVLEKGRYARATGLFFKRQTTDSLCEVLEEFSDSTFRMADCRARAEQFSEQTFRTAWENLVDSTLRKHRGEFI